MTALMSQDPETSTKEALNDGIHSPKPSSKYSRRDIFWSNVCVEDHEDDRQTTDVSSNIAQPPQTRAVEAVSGDGISNVVDRVVWKFELVSIRINELPIRRISRILQ